jgi:hypothetical protein
MRKIKYSTAAYEKYTKRFGIFLLIILISGCNRPPDSQLHNQQIPFSISWQPEVPRVEQPIVFSLTLPPELMPELSEVRGVSMYMGRIPLQWQALEPGLWQATLLVGACTEAQMQWQLLVPLRAKSHDSNHEQALEPLRVLFSTVTN